MLVTFEGATCKTPEYLYFYYVSLPEKQFSKYRLAPEGSFEDQQQDMDSILDLESAEGIIRNFDEELKNWKFPRKTTCGEAVIVVVHLLRAIGKSVKEMAIEEGNLVYMNTKVDSPSRSGKTVPLNHCATLFLRIIHHVDKYTGMKPRSKSTACMGYDYHTPWGFAEIISISEATQLTTECKVLEWILHRLHLYANSYDFHELLL
ncbi:hypothetical protein Tco_0674121 [Tanacetum coccineum]